MMILDILASALTASQLQKHVTSSIILSIRELMRIYLPVYCTVQCTVVVQYIIVNLAKCVYLVLFGSTGLRILNLMCTARIGELVMASV